MSVERFSAERFSLILASRTYQPVDDIDSKVSGPMIAFGSTPIAIRAEMLGARRKPLETTRATLLALAKEPGTHVVMFVARDPATKQPTEGIAGIQHLLSSKGIPFSTVSSPFPARICELLTEFDAQVEQTRKTVDRAGGKRRIAIMQKTLATAARVVDARDEYVARLESGKNFEVGVEALDDKYLGWIRVYTALCDALERAKVVLA